MKEEINWLSHWFIEKNENLTLNKEDITSNYFQLGLIDSFGVICLIDDIEKYFSIKLSQTHFEQRRFSTIQGLAEIIGEIREQSNDTL